MFSRLEAILRPVARHAESTDTRLSIRKDESKHYGRNKQGKGQDEYAPVAWEDTATVSTASLRTFLQSLLSGPSTIQTSATQTAQTTPPEERHAPTTVGHRASNAYQTMGRAVHDRNVEAPPPPPSSGLQHSGEGVHLGQDFGDAERKQVEAFIGDLLELERRDIHEITIQRSMTFLDSVKQGIETAKLRL